MKSFIAFLFLMLAVCAFAQSKHFDGMRIRENKGVIGVLEAPLFAVPDESSRVIQYVRKGDEIYIHPAEFQRDRYQGLVDADPDVLEAYSELYDKEHPDPLFEEGVYTPVPGSKFYKTMASSGKDAFILKDHVFLLYHDPRELEQNIAYPDPTDYRIEEPLPEGFPLKQPSGVRSYVSLALGSPSDTPYDYGSDIKDQGYGLFKEINAVWTQRRAEDVTSRFYLGGMLSLSQKSLEYILEDRKSEENNIKLSLGPYASWDFWRSEGFTLTAFGSIQFVFFDSLEIKQEARDGSADSDTRTFTSYHFSPRVGLSYQRPKVLKSLDLLAGTALSVELPHTYETQSKVDQASWWKGNEFTRPYQTQVSFFIGLQSNI